MERSMVVDVVVSVVSDFVTWRLTWTRRIQQW